nr:MAG TPA: hypothetical protein [Bacteriophage sp.]DAH37750.1 MAG TPA: hypothetical protein [Caudoviricetes sp.]
MQSSRLLKTNGIQVNIERFIFHLQVYLMVKSRRLQKRVLHSCLNICMTRLQI